MTRAMNQLVQIEQLTDNEWIQSLDKMNEQSVKFAWKRWLASKDLHKLLIALRGVRQDIAAALTVLTA